MIFQLANRYQRSLGSILLFVFYISFLSPIYAYTHIPGRTFHPVNNDLRSAHGFSKTFYEDYISRGGMPLPEKVVKANMERHSEEFVVDDDNGGPSKPEANSFKSVSANDLVNLFTGSFSYNIPLMDVGGYPINIFYNGVNGVEDEASWVGLGWNINPGTINRNMRGIPDDFDGSDQFVQTMTMKPNITYGGTVGASVEIFGVKNLKMGGFSLGLDIAMGVLYNNYLGPALDLNIGPNLTYAVSTYSVSEKDNKKDSSVLGGKLKLGVNLGISSRSGSTLGASVSMTAMSFKEENMLAFGIGAGTSYNSRSGIKALNVFEQYSFNVYSEKNAVENYKGNTSKAGGSINLHNSSISFVKGSYMPALRMPITNTTTAGSVQLGTGMFGMSAALHTRAFKQKSEVEPEDIIQKKSLVGFIYSHKGQNNRDAVMDFTRLNDREVTPNTTIISAPQYSYDVFSITGEGTGGVIRAYLKDMGTMRDNHSQTKDKSISFSVDLGLPGHVGADFNQIKTPSSIGEWTYGNQIKAVLGVKENKGLSEHVYFRNPGESNVLEDNEYTRIGNNDLVRFALGGDGANPVIRPQLERFTDPATTPDYVNIGFPVSENRKKRTQVITMLTAGEAAEVGLEKVLRNYNRDTLQMVLDDTLSYQAIGREHDYRKSHHISEINVLEADGSRYVYGQPVYNIIQKDYSFSVSNAADNDDLVGFTSNQAGANSPLLNANSNRDGYVQITEMPAYASNFLLTGLLSSDYVDVTGNGITEDDLGNAVKFNYSKSVTNYKWRTPHVNGPVAHAHEGNLSSDRDDKGVMTYGERESWYLHSVESKTMVAIFTLENRSDGKGVSSEFGNINAGDNSLQRLKKIDLYNKSDIKENGISQARPVKTVWFNYNYSLIKNAPGNTQTAQENSGKLTLESLHFTYYGQNKAEKDQYVFAYNDSANYKVSASDRWGSYKPKGNNPNGIKNSVYPYAVQDSTIAANNAKSWNLSKILLPSGSQIEVTYEANDYAYVQDRRAARMMSIRSIGRGNIAGGSSLYDIAFPGFVENTRVHINVPVNCISREDVYRLYLEGVNQLAFKLAVMMPKGKEYVPVYANISDYGVGSVPNTIWVELKTVNGFSPLTLAALNYLREKLPGQAFPGYDVSDAAGIEVVGKMLVGMVDGLSGMFKDVAKYMRSKGYARLVVLPESFVRLNEPEGKKYGGGLRVKKVVLKDNWDQLSGLYNTEYGQVYDYTITENFAGVNKVISSGVASYEPSIGGEENPFLEIVQVADKLPLGPTSYGAIEMPVLDAFFPAPVVGYRKITVYSLNKFKTPVDKKSRSGIGKQVTEFYTAKDFPVKYKHTLLDRSAEKYFRNQNKLWEFFASYSLESRALTQGFLVEINDMHGKLKSQSSYGEEDENTPINYSGYFYRNTGVNGMNDKFDFAHHQLGGEIKKGNMGIDIELMTDTREFLVNAQSIDVQAQVEWTVPVPPIWVPVILPVSGDHANEYRAVTTTKVVNYRAVLDSMIVITNGSVISTKNMVFDAETGSVIVNRTNNEFDDPLYSTTYPAYWAYKAMGPAYKNINAVYHGVSFSDGRVAAGMTQQEVNETFESGDELYMLYAPAPSDDCGKAIASIYSPINVKKVWALDKKKNIDSLHIENPDFIFITEDGTFFTAASTTFRIVRSGKRNMLSATLASFVSSTSPVSTTMTEKLVFNAESKVINSSALAYREIWQNDKDVFKKGILVPSDNGCFLVFSENCEGHYQHANPYVKGLLGNFAPYKEFVFHGDRDLTTITTQLSNIRKDGVMLSFVPYWSFNAFNKLIPTDNSHWIWTKESTRFNSKGLEAESVNPLGIYSAVQYGYMKNLPVAVATNSRYQEMAYSGFEDDIYNGSLNKGSLLYCKNNQFLVQDQSSVVKAENYSINAHSGKYVAKVDAGHNVILNNNIEITDIPNYRYSFDFNQKDTLKRLIDTGFVLDTAYITYPPDMLAQEYFYDWFKSNITPVSNTSTGISMLYNLMNIFSNELTTVSTPHIIHAKTTNYINVDKDSMYNLRIQFSGNTSPEEINNIKATINIYDENNNLIHTVYHNAYMFRDFPVWLCKGAYKIEFITEDDIRRWNYFENAWEIRFNSGIRYTLNIASKVYKSLTSVDDCTYTKPIPVSEDMMNPLFSLPAGKKMLISGWVTERCGTSTCNYDSLTNGKLRLVFRNSSNVIISTQDFSASGPIIESWQKIEQPFTIPAGAVKASLQLVNTSGSAVVYFDDIRIHPFDAQMNSYVYDPINLRLLAQQDENNYSTFFDYDEEGGLIRTRVETERGIKTINESRSHKQSAVKTIQ